MEAAPKRSTTRSKQSPPGSLSASSRGSSHTFPEWVQAATKEDKLARPWTKQSAAAVRDDPNFAREKDTIVFFNPRNGVCHGEGSMAA